jgi:hypothetical protein
MVHLRVPTRVLSAGHVLPKRLDWISRLIGSVRKRRLVDGSVVRILVGGPEL